MIDKNQKIQDLKIGLWILLIFSVVINPFWSLVIGLVYYFKLKEVEISNSRYNLICGLILFIGVAGCVISGKGVSELWPDSLFLFAINSPRVVFLAIDLFILRYAWNLMTKKPEELMVIEEKKKQENAIPVMGYDDNNDRHILIAGTTGSGKTVVITNLIKNALKNGKPILIVNGKQDSHDTKGLYKVTKFLCEKYGVNCYLVSTDVNLKDTYSYKFSENRTKTNIINGFASSLRFEKDVSPQP